MTIKMINSIILFVIIICCFAFCGKTVYSYYHKAKHYIEGKRGYVIYKVDYRKHYKTIDDIFNDQTEA